MKMFRKFCALLLAVVLLIPMYVPAKAADGMDYGYYEDLSAYNGHSYKVFNEAMTWTEAEAFCERLGGTLAVITSAEENGFVASLVSQGDARNCYWIGMRGGEGGWSLVNGEPASYFNWAPNEPNNFDNHAESYVHMFGVRYTGGKGIKEVGHWNDVINDGAEYAGEFYAAGNFGFVCEWADTDEDGLYDGWERNGIDVDADGTVDVPIHEMGADPETKDIFVEVDWMERPRIAIIKWEHRSYVNYAPTREALEMVASAFSDHGINLHVDAGANSVNMGSFTAYEGAAEIPYDDVYSYGSLTKTAQMHMGPGRELAFRYCIFVNQYKTGLMATTSSGIAQSFGGTRFLVANQDWVRNGGAISVAGTFMHELGHCLNLHHGGQDDVNYKPNYLSIMNYLFQNSGIAGTWELNYSDYTLPPLDETNLNENNGVDPFGQTAGTFLGTSWYRNGVQESMANVSGRGIDFDQDGTMEAAVHVDLNNGAETMLTSYTDWDRISFSGGMIGGSLAGESLDETEEQYIVERDLEEALRSNTLDRPGGHSVRLVSNVLLTDAKQQSLILEISNRTAVEETFRVTVSADGLAEELEQDVVIPASVDRIETVRVEVPVSGFPEEGAYTLKVHVSCRDVETTEKIPVTVTALTQEEREELLVLVDNGDLEDSGLDPAVVAQITAYANQPVLEQYLPYILIGFLCVSALGAIIMTVVLVVGKKRRRK